MTDYKIWKPEHDGHAPPNWREGMKWTLEALPLAYNAVGNPNWDAREVYHVEPEALNSPNDDAETPDAVETGKLENIVRGLRQYPAEELAAHGIVFTEPKDAFAELWADLLDVWELPIRANLVRVGDIYDVDRKAIELLRTRFEQMIAERSITHD